MDTNANRRGSAISRRDVIKYGGTLAAAAGLVRAGATPAAASTPPAEADATLVVYDMAHLFSLDLTDPAQARAAYDEMHLVATLQGIVNRDRPRLYVKIAYHDDFGSADIDGFWLDYLQQPNHLLAGRPTRAATGLDDLLATFRKFLRGAVIWDPQVWATSNVASTVAGVEDLVAVRYDPSPGSLYARYVAAPPASDVHLPGVRWLIHPDGSTVFTGTGTIHGTTLPSTGSAKCDAYMWAKVHYLDTGRCDPGQLGYYLDAYWLTNPTLGGLLVAMVMNHDYLVSRKGFILDLDPWGDERPVDDPDQPLGTDRSTWQAVLTSAYRGTGGQMTAIHGFVPWQYKYSFSPHNGVGAEWESVQLVSSYNGYLDADAPGEVGGMANASVYAHTPLKTVYPQDPPPSLSKLQERGLVAADGSVVPKRYVMFYVGDYDSASWIYHAVPRFWPDPNRGAVPLSWTFNPNLSDRIAPAFLYTRSSKTSNDVFIAGDSGAGYLNPSMLEPPRPSGLPSGLPAWQRHCARYFRLWDISVTGFIIDGASPAMDEAGREAYAQFSTNGFAEQAGPPLGITGTTPYLQGAQGGDLARLFTGDTTAAPYLPQFLVYRNTLQTPTWYKQTVDQINSTLPNAEVTFVDALTFFALLRQYLYDQVVATIAATFVAVVPGQAVPITLQLTSYRNADSTGTVSITTPTGWTTNPAVAQFSLAAESSGQATIEVEAPAGLPAGQRYDLAAVVTVDGNSRSYGFQARTSSTAVGTATVSTVLGATNTDDGLSQVEVSGDGRTEAVTVAGESARRMVEAVPNDLNMYFDVDNGVANDGQFQATFTVDYYDEAAYTWQLQYDSTNPAGALGGAYTTAGSVTNGGSGTWRTATFTVNDARFAGRENGGTDFRIFSATGPITIHRVQVVVSGVGVTRT